MPSKGNIIEAREWHYLLTGLINEIRNALLIKSLCVLVVVCLVALELLRYSMLGSGYLSRCFTFVEYSRS